MAQFSQSASADIGVSNDFSTGPNDSFLVLDGDFSSTGSQVFAGGSYSFTGDNRDFSTQTMDFTGNASASSQFKRLRTSVSASVDNVFYNEENVPYLDYVNDEINDEFGVPTDFIVNAEAQFTDTLQYGGTATGYTSRYLLNLTGTITGTEAFVFIEIDHGTSGVSQDILYFEPGTYNINIASDTFVGGPNQTFSIRLFTSFQASAFFAEDGDNLTGTADFGNTLELVGVEVRDQDTNQLLSADQVVGASGESYSVLLVPEPAAAVLVATGLALLAQRRRSA
ncbi:MAG: hypothetical protein AAF086_02815 [Planctomycetota bacterium]